MREMSRPEFNEKQSSEFAFEADEIDRLVDGELDSPDRNRLLQRFEEEPAGWRQCALAFLESQLWSEDLQRIADDHPSPREAETAVTVLPLVSPRTTKTISWLATAATVVVAFSLGQKMNDKQGIATTPAQNTVAVSNVNLPEVPVVDQQWLNSPQVPRDVEELLKELGAEIRQESGVVFREDKAGRRRAVPYRDVEIVPVRATAY